MVVHLIREEDKHTARQIGGWKCEGGSATMETACGQEILIGEEGGATSVTDLRRWFCAEGTTGMVGNAREERRRIEDDHLNKDDDHLNREEEEEEVRSR